MSVCEIEIEVINPDAPNIEVSVDGGCFEVDISPSDAMPTSVEIQSEIKQGGDTDYTLWLQIEGNEGKTVEEYYTYLESLKSGGFFWSTEDF